MTIVSAPRTDATLPSAITKASQPCHISKITQHPVPASCLSAHITEISGRLADAGTGAVHGAESSMSANSATAGEKSGDMESGSGGVWGKRR